MNKDSLISKMAEGFYQNAKNNNEVNLNHEDLKFLVWNLKKNPDLNELMSNPFTGSEEKYNSLVRIFGDVVNKEVLLFSKMLLDNDVFSSLEEVLNIYTSLANKDNDVLEGVIYTPFELNESQIKKITDAFIKLLNKKCVFEVSLDKSLIAGIKILIDGYMYEYNVNDMLNDIKNRLINEEEEKKNEK